MVILCVCGTVCCVSRSALYSVDLEKEEGQMCGNVDCVL